MRSRPVSLSLVVLAVLLLGALAAFCAGSRQAQPPTPSPTPPPPPAAAPTPTPAAAGTAPQPELQRAAAPPAVAAPVDPAAEVHGIVRDGSGAPIAAAVVTARRGAADAYGLLDREAGESAVVASARTAADGSYHFALPPRRPHQLMAVAPGLAPAHRGGVCAGSRVDFVLAAPAGLRGVVTRERDGSAVAGARVRGWRRDALGARVGRFEAETDADGAFECASLAPGTCTLAVQPVDAAGPRWQQVELRAGEVTTVALLVPIGDDVGGTVLDAQTLRPIAGARVREGSAGRELRTDADGRFALPGFNRMANVDIHVEAEGYAPTEAVVITAGNTGVRTPIEVRLRRGHRAHGRVADADGAPLAGVYVAAAASDHEGAQDLQRIDWSSCRSDAEGRFVLTQLRPDMRHTLFLRAEGHATMLYDFPASEPEVPDLDLGSFFLPPSGSVRGHLRDEQGLAIAGHAVSLAGHNRDRARDRPASGEYDSVDSYIAEQHAVTDQDGGFAFADVAAGDYEVVAFELDSHAQKRLPVTLAPGQDQGGVDMVLFRGASIQGRVASADGKNIATCYLSIDPEDGQASNADVEAAADGSFRARGLLPGNYRITAYPYASEQDRAAGRSLLSVTQEHVVAGAADVHLVLPVQATVRGVVRDAAGQPAAGRQVRVLAAGTVTDSGSTDSDGRFALHGPAEAALEVQVFESGARAASLAGIVILAQAAIAAGGGEVVLALPR